MRVAPYESCIACYRGDVTTAVALRGEPEWIMGALVAKVGLPNEKARRAMLVFAEQHGCEPGTLAVRLCTTCAAKRDVPVAEVAGEFPCYAQES